MTFVVTGASLRRILSVGAVALPLLVAGATAQALPLEITTTSLSDATAGVDYSDAVVATGGTGPYTWSLASGSLPTGISLDSGTGGLTGIETAAGTSAFIIRVEDALGDTATRALTLTVGPAAATALTFDQQPGSIIAGAAFSPDVVVSVRDAFGNVVTGSSDAITVSLTSGTGTLLGTTTVTAVSGVATFTGLTIQVAGPGKQLAATNGELPAVTSDAFTVSAGAAASLVFVQPPSAAVAGDLIAPAVTVGVRDEFGNGVAGVMVSLALTGSGTLVGGVPVASDGSGVATFAGLSIDVAGAKQLTASSDPLTPVTSDPFTISAGAAATLTFEQQPSAALVGATIVPAVTVRVRDAFGNGVAGEPVSLSLTGAGMLAGGGAVASDSTGLATFASLSVDREGTKQLGATAGAIGPVPSAPFVISCPAISLGPLSLPAGTIGTPYSETISAAGGRAPYAYVVTAGTLPPGLALDPGSGVLSGSPGVAGSYAFTITATDSDSCAGNHAYNLGICPSISVLPAALPAASVGIAYGQTFTSSTGAAPFTYGVVAGSLPPGLVLGEGGDLSGAPTTAGSFAFTIGVTANDGCTASGAYVLDVIHVPAAVTDLAADRVVTGNDADGTSKIQISFTMPPGGTAAEVYRAPFGGYPKYDDAGGVVPPTPSYPPSAPWVLTTVTSSGQTDEPASRDFYYYVAFVENAGGGRSDVSNKTSGTCNYALGDVSNGVLAGAGDNLVDNVDVSLLGANYGIGASLIASRGVAYLDVGPTTDLMLTSRPFTDGKINFEDLIVFAGNYGLVSAPLLAARTADGALRAATSPEEFTVEAPSLVSADQTVTAILKLSGAGRMQGFSAELEWDRNVVEPIGTTSGGYVESRGGVTLSPQPGTVDAALLGVRPSGMTGEGEVARLSFRVLREGDAAIRLGRVVARDAANRPVADAAIGQATRLNLPAKTILLAPWPNPAGGAVTLAFGLASASNVDLTLYSVDGRRVKTLASGWREGGVHRITWSGDDELHRAVPPGIYYAHLSVAGQRFTRTLVRLK